jgi:hypothetical protein
MRGFGQAMDRSHTGAADTAVVSGQMSRTDFRFAVRLFCDEPVTAELVFVAEGINLIFI